MKYTTYIELNGKILILDETNDLDFALMVYEKTAQMCELIGRSCWIIDNDNDTEIKSNN